MRDDEIERPVKPRKPYDPYLPIIVVHGNEIYTERTDGHHLLERLPAVIATEPPSYIAVHEAGTVLGPLHEAFKHDPRWQYKLTPVQRTTGHTPTRGTQHTVTTVSVNFFGWQANKHQRSRYFYPLDPLVFARQSAPQIRGRKDIDILTALFEWAKDLRAFAVENQLRVSSTSGGIAAQLLRDPRFYPEPRRKVPAATNRKARVNLPGNFYRLNAESERFYRAVYLDQEAAHHNAAKSIEFPHADRLFAKGWFNRNGCNGCNGYWSRPGTPHFQKIISQPGLFYLRLWSPHVKPGTTVPPFMETVGEHDTFIYSNELPMVERLGGKIIGLYAAWTSTVVDKGLNKYALWALDQIKAAPPETLNWLKPTLLSAYGILAAKPRRLEFAFLQAKSGELKELPVGPALLPVFHKRTAGKFEPGFANVIQRGMIEAETRKRSIELANELANGGLEVLAVYADSVFVRRNGPLPLLPAGWGVKSDLDGLRFLNAVQFTSRQLVKLPGIPREAQERYLQSRAGIAA